MIGRREFIGLLGGGAVAWPLTARAQQAGKLPTIGFLGSSTPQIASVWTTPFVQRLRELGWIEGRTVAVEYRWAEGRIARAVEIATEFVRLKVNVIVTSGTGNIEAAKNATSSIPIVFAVAGDPVATGLVTSLAQPGGNATGLSLQQDEVAEKRLELLREIVPDLDRLAILLDVGHAEAVLEMRKVQVLAKALGFDVALLEIRRVEDLAPAFEALNGRAKAIYVCGGPFMATHRVRVNTLVLSARLPVVYDARVFVEVGGLMAYGPNFPDLYRRAGDYVDKILRGAKPQDIPVEQPTKFDLVVNLITAKSLGISVPPTLLARANEVIE
jgi:ABC-type uncharacterized transport system substrate-binding protein